MKEMIVKSNQQTDEKYNSKYKHESGPPVSRVNLTSQSGFTIQFLMELVGEYDGAVGERCNMCIFLGVTLSGEYLSGVILKRCLAFFVILLTCLV